jgi:hypothetical protein
MLKKASKYKSRRRRQPRRHPRVAGMFLITWKVALNISSNIPTGVSNQPNARGT